MTTQKTTTQTDWHRLFGITLTDYFSNSNYQVNAIKLRNLVGWVERERYIVMGRPTHHCYKFQRFGGCSEALPTLQKSLT
ncbi:hypothetical protein PN36_06075 [Candidatus Thiomargarita nelsonii]|uniref:Uncharacterized protein n=1 Tax=Candidatus Thiomargarita nelsonii TaxID=1003181 RepID=A0A4E0QRG9_9GAMM|nr:hypothetical protein PN36_06075 [Candidatus Thiomargarita nelsonii]